MAEIIIITTYQRSLLAPIREPLLSYCREKPKYLQKTHLSDLVTANQLSFKSTEPSKFQNNLKSKCFLIVLVLLFCSVYATRNRKLTSRVRRSRSQNVLHYCHLIGLVTQRVCIPTLYFV